MRIWPFTNFHELNADWILRTMEELKTQIAQALGGVVDYASRLLNVEHTCSTLTTTVSTQGAAITTLQSSSAAQGAAITDLQQSALRFTSQNLSAAARAQARGNIKAVSYEIQELTAEEKETARHNIGAVSSDTLTQQISTRLPVSNPSATGSMTVRKTSSDVLPPTLTVQNHPTGATYYSANEINTHGMQVSGNDEYGVYDLMIDGGIDSQGPRFRLYNAAAGAASDRVPLRNIATPVSNTDAVPLDYVRPLQLQVELTSSTAGTYSGAPWAQLLDAASRGRTVAFVLGNQRINVHLSGYIDGTTLYSGLFYLNGAAICATINEDNEISLSTL